MSKVYILETDDPVTFKVKCKQCAHFEIFTRNNHFESNCVVSLGSSLLLGVCGLPGL